MNLSPHIVCFTFEDDTTSDSARNIHVDITIMRSSWLLWHAVENVDGYFTVDVVSKEVALRTVIPHKGNKVEVSRVYQIGG